VDTTPQFPCIIQIPTCSRVVADESVTYLENRLADLGVRKPFAKSLPARAAGKHQPLNLCDCLDALADLIQPSLKGVLRRFILSQYWASPTHSWASPTSRPGALDLGLGGIVASMVS
jgi:hypothetical protein